jgi:uncharacterized protein (TIGR04255 family)
MLRDLPEPSHERLPQAPVDLVIWQLQFAEAADVANPAVGTHFAEVLSDEAGAFQLQRLAAPALVFPLPNALQLPGSMDPAQGWSLRRNGTIVTVGAQALAVETNNYETYTEFRMVLDRALVALHDSVLPPGEQRLGLRYVDRVSRPEVKRAADWAGLLEPWLVGPLGHRTLGDAVGAYAQQVDFEPDSQNIRATVRQRVFADADQRGRQTVMLDYDVFREGYRVPDREEAMAATDQMNDISKQLFEASITDGLRAVFATPPEEA